MRAVARSEFSAFVQHVFLESCGHSLLAFFGGSIMYHVFHLLTCLHRACFRSSSSSEFSGREVSLSVTVIDFLSFFCRLTVEFLLDGVTDIIFFISKKIVHCESVFRSSLGRQRVPKMFRHQLPNADLSS